jgi:hypothetical protein
MHQGRKGNLLLYNVLRRGRVFSAAALLMRMRSQLASHRYVTLIMRMEMVTAIATKKMQMVSPMTALISGSNGLDLSTCLSIVR